MSPRPLFPRTAGAALLVALALTACSDDSGNEDEEESANAPTTEEPTTTTTHPSTTDDEAAAFAIVEEVFDERQRLMDEMTEQPELVNDPQSDHVERLRELVTGPMEETVDGRVQFAEDLAAAGERLQAAGEVISDSGIYRLEAVDADTIVFDVCVLGDDERVDNEGQFIDNNTFGMFGDGEARRVEGRWRLYRLENDPNANLDEDDLVSGGLQRGACDDAFETLPIDGGGS